MRQVDRQCQTTARGDRRVLVHDRREVVTHDDEVDAGVRPCAGSEVREDLAVRRPHGEMQCGRPGLGDARRALPVELVLLRRCNRGRRGRAAASTAAGTHRGRARPGPRRAARSLALREQVALVRRDVAADLEHDLVVPLQRHPPWIAVPCPGRCGTPVRGRRTRAGGVARAAGPRPRTGHRAPAAAPGRRIPCLSGRACAADRRRRRPRDARCPPAEWRAQADAGGEQQHLAVDEDLDVHRVHGTPRGAAHAGDRASVRYLMRSGRQHEPGFARHRRWRRRRGGHQHALSLAQRAPRQPDRNPRFTQRVGGALVRAPPQQDLSFASSSSRQ